MKVALVIEKFSPSGGAERACANLARGLVRRGHEVHVFAREIAPADGIVPRPVRANAPFRHASFARTSRFLLERETFDIIHSFTRTSYQDVLRLGGGTHVEYLARTDCLYGLIGRWWRRAGPKVESELLLEKASLSPKAYRKVVAVSNRVRDEAIRHYGVRPEDLVVIYNGVDAEEFKPDPAARAHIRAELGLSGDDYLLLFCGTGFKRKGLDFAISAVERTNAVRLAVAGEGSARPHPRVRMLGRRTDVSRLYAAADALLLPTLYDPFPNVCLEAMASGIPVIVSRIAGVSEIIEADSIVVEDPTNVAELAAAIDRLRDPAVRKPMGEAARRKALQFTLDRVLEENLRVYGEILKRKETR